MLALSKSDSSPLILLALQGQGGPCEPRAGPRGLLQGFSGLGRG